VIVILIVVSAFKTLYVFFCQNSLSGGTCQPKAQQCTNGQQLTTCPTPSPSYTPTPTPTPTPGPTPTPTQSPCSSSSPNTLTCAECIAKNGCGVCNYGTTIGSSKCSTQYECANTGTFQTTCPTTAPTPTPTPTPNPTPTPTASPCSFSTNTVSCSDCVAKNGCGMCYSSTTSGSYAKCSTQSECGINTASFKTVCDTTAPAPTPTPTPTPVPPPPTSDCNVLTSCQTCAAKEGCGWCESQTKTCVKVATTSNTAGSAIYCKSNGGIWYERSCTTVVYPPVASPSPSPSPSPNDPTVTPKIDPTYNTATVKGTVSSTSTVDKTASDKVASVIQKTVADSLKIDQSKVIVGVTTTLNNDGTTTFSINIKVDSTTVSNDEFVKGVSSISSSSIENSITNEGVSVQSGSVSINSNTQNSFSERIVFVSLTLIGAVLLF